MKFLPSVVRNDDTRLAVLQMVLGGHNAAVSAEQLAALLPEESEGVAANFGGMADVLSALGCEIGPQFVSAEYILAAQQPTIILVQVLPTEPPYPVVVWNKVGSFYQVIDPHIGRRWLSHASLAAQLYCSPQTQPKDYLWQLLQHDTQTALLQQRLRDLKVSDDDLLTKAQQSLNAWLHLDAALRTVEELVANGARRGHDAEQLLRHVLSDGEAMIPAWHWLITSTDDDRVGQFQGMLALPLLACVVESAAEETAQVEEPVGESPQSAEEDPPPEQKSIFRLIVQYLQEEGAFHPAIVVSATVVAAMGLFLEAILLRGMMEIGIQLETLEQRRTAMLLLIGLVFLLFLMSWALRDQALRFGRRIDMRLRQAGFGVVPRLSDQYFQQLAPADITDRLHNLHQVPKLATNASSFLNKFTRIIMITLGIAWIDWPLVFINYLMIYAGTAFFISASRSLYQDNYREQTLNGWLSVLYVDAVRGRSSIWSHGAEQSMRYEYDQGLTQYGQAFLMRQWRAVLIVMGSFVATVLSPIFQLVIYTARGGSAVNLLLLFYWIMELNQLMSATAGEAGEAVTLISHANRFGEILQTPREAELLNIDPAEPDVSDDLPSSAESPPYIRMDDVTVQIGGQKILHGINLSIKKGEHVAIIGTSGAGKSTLVSVLLGRHYAASGQVWFDGEPLDYDVLSKLRADTAWVDPNMQLWDESLLYNLQYGTRRSELSNLLHNAIEQADLLSVLERMPNGLASRLGEGGKYVSGGEGQRIRFGRGLHRSDSSLVILDEAFRGIDRAKRDTLLRRARTYWADTTLLCVTHDVSHTLNFERVLVLDNGYIVEDDDPKNLMAQPDSRYRALLEEEKMVRVRLWENEEWRHLRLEAGTLAETDGRN